MSKLILCSLLLAVSIQAQFFGRDPRWRTVGVGTLASRPVTCAVNRDVYICNGAGCGTNGEYHYCTGGLGATTFTGVGLNDLTFSGTPAVGGLAYRVQIDASIPSPDTFEWSDNGGAPWDATGVGITGAAQALNNGVVITFGAIDGHTVGDRWDMTTLSWTVSGVGSITGSGTAGKVTKWAGASAIGNSAVLSEVNGHLEFGGTSPAVASGAGDCGTAPSIVGNDNIGRVVVGTDVNGGKCTVTFVSAWTNAPICVVANETTANLLRPVNVSTTAFEITGTILAGDKLAYKCFGYL